MEIALIIIGIIALLVGTAAISQRVRVAAPLLLVTVGIALGFLPGVPAIQIDPEIILVGLLPPLLYAAAVQVPIMDFRRNLQPIAGLSVLLVLLTALVVGLIVHWAFPSIPMALGVALGAVVAPPDAVAATSIGKRAGLPHRLVTILEGESLVNDATSLVLLRTALAAVAGGFVLWNSIALFLYAAAVAVLVGLAIGMIMVWLRSRLNNPVYDTVISFTVPFIAFIPAEFLHASGILAVVTTGLYVGHLSARKFSANARTSERVNWRTVQFLLENGVFLMMGLQMHSLIDQIQETDFELFEISMLSLALVLVLVVCRTAFMFPLVWTMRFRATRYEHRSFMMRALIASGFGRDSLTERQEQAMKRVRRAQQKADADLSHEQEEGLEPRDATVLSWAAMRGVVTLAAAQTIPTSFPERPQLILVAFFVAVATLMLHGLTLPTVIRLLQPNSRSTDARRAELQSMSSDLIEVGVETAQELLSTETDAEDETSQKLRERLLHSAKASVMPLMFALPRDVNESDPHSAQSKYLRIANQILEAQKSLLIEERAIGRYSSTTLKNAQQALDQYEIQLRPPAQ
ncbi:MAG: cation:proton antiporter [Canibacter sp.]